MIEIDGSYLEGGGQIVRTAMALSAVTQKPTHIKNIRKGRQNPGMRAQHVEAASAIAALCGAEIKGNVLHSTELKFYPKKIHAGKIAISIPTAGSVGLVLQPLMIAASRAEGTVSVEIDGGATNGKWAQPVNHIKYVFLPLLEKFGYEARIEVRKYGYYPAGGAHVFATISPARMSPITLTERGKICEVRGISHASSSLKKAQVAERQAKTAVHNIEKDLNMPAAIDAKYFDTLNPGSAVELFAICENSVLGAEGLGERKKRAEDVGAEAAKKIAEEIRSGACVDEYTEDQLLPYMALAAENGESAVRVPKVTNHTRTNMWVIEKFLPVRFFVGKEKIIRCKSI